MKIKNKELKLKDLTMINNIYIIKIYTVFITASTKYPLRQLSGVLHRQTDIKTVIYLGKDESEKYNTKTQ